MRVTKLQEYNSRKCGNRANFSGMPEKLAQSVPDALLKSKSIHGFCKMAEKNASLFDVSFALIMGATIGTGGIMALPKQKKEDRQYMSTLLILNCLATFLLSLALYIPLSKSIAKLGQNALKNASTKGGFPYKEGSKEYDSYNYIINYGSRFILAPLQALMIVKGITPIYKKLFQQNDGGGKK